MQELTLQRIDAELAEQLPARELMNMTYARRSAGTYQTNVAYQGNTAQFGLVNLNVSNDQVNILSAFNSNGGIYQSNY